MQNRRDKSLAKPLNFLNAVGIGGLASRQNVEVIGNVIGRLDRCRGRGFIPGLRDQGPAFVTQAAVVWGKRSGNDEGRRRVSRRKIPRRDGLLGPGGRIPRNRDRSAFTGGV